MPRNNSGNGGEEEGLSSLAEVREFRILADIMDLVGRAGVFLIELLDLKVRSVNGRFYCETSKQIRGKGGGPANLNYCYN